MGCIEVERLSTEVELQWVWRSWSTLCPRVEALETWL